MYCENRSSPPRMFRVEVPTAFWIVCRLMVAAKEIMDHPLLIAPHAMFSGMGIPMGSKDKYENDDDNSRFLYQLFFRTISWK